MTFPRNIGKVQEYALTCGQAQAQHHLTPTVPSPGLSGCRCFPSRWSGRLLPSARSAGRLDRLNLVGILKSTLLAAEKMRGPGRVQGSNRANSRGGHGLLCPQNAFRQLKPAVTVKLWSAGIDSVSVNWPLFPSIQFRTLMIFVIFW